MSAEFVNYAPNLRAKRGDFSQIVVRNEPNSAKSRLWRSTKAEF